MNKIFALGFMALAILAYNDDAKADISASEHINNIINLCNAGDKVACANVPMALSMGCDMNIDKACKVLGHMLVKRTPLQRAKLCVTGVSQAC